MCIFIWSIKVGFDTIGGAYVFGKNHHHQFSSIIVTHSSVKETMKKGKRAKYLEWFISFYRCIFKVYDMIIIINNPKITMNAEVCLLQINNFTCNTIFQTIYRDKPYEYHNQYYLINDTIG